MKQSNHAVRVTASLVDGGAMDWTFGPNFLTRMERLSREGLTGKLLVDALITDDWAAPPSVVTVSWVDSDGRAGRRVILYD